jgi:hypothetical protein
MYAVLQGDDVLVVIMYFLIIVTGRPAKLFKFSLAGQPSFSTPHHCYTKACRVFHFLIIVTKMTEKLFYFFKYCRT